MEKILITGAYVLAIVLPFVCMCYIDNLRMRIIRLEEMKITIVNKK